MKTLKAKALASYESAVLLADRNRFDDAANRAYYSLYQAICGALEEEHNLKYSQFTGKSGKPCNYWEHQLVEKLSNRVLPVQDEETVIDAQDLRITADYRTESVARDELYRILYLVPEILDTLGVPKE